MPFLLLGGLTLLVVMSALGMFSRAQVKTIKAFGVWMAAIGGLLMAAMLFLTGRGIIAIALLGLLGPMLWSWRTGQKPARPGQARPGQGRGGTRGGGMSREEAFAVLGLQPGADPAAIQAAYVRLMQAAHPDRGGSDWLASRINQARDVLLG
jgi:DnaJ family protein C protein 19